MDELHFLINCKLYEPERQRLFLMKNEKKKNFQGLNDVEKCTFLLSSPDNQLIVWIGKFIYKCFQARSESVLKKGVMYIKYTWPPYFISALGLSLKSVVLIPPYLPWNRGAGSVVAGGSGGCHSDSSRRPRWWRGGLVVRYLAVFNVVSSFYHWCYYYFTIVQPALCYLVHVDFLIIFVIYHGFIHHVFLCKLLCQKWRNKTVKSNL